jgi:hypothetical protein
LSRLVNHSKKGHCEKKERILKPWINTGGYVEFMLYKNGKTTRFKAHTLVGIVFLGYDQTSEMTINHKDFRRDNNYYKNLEITSYRENLSHMALNRKTSSEYIGVAFNNFHKKFQAYIRIEKKLKHLGYFIEEEEARQAYLDALKEYGLTNKYATETQEKS